MIERASECGRDSLLADALNNFRCCKDIDIETFLREKAVTFLERRWCSVYLVLDEAAFDIGKIRVEAYFTLSHKSLIPKSASKTQIQSASGFKDSASLHFVLIGQLGKYISNEPECGEVRASITSKEILDYAFDVVRASSNLIPCRCVMVECSSNEKVQKMYTDYGFSKFQYDGDYYQFYKKI